MSEWADLGLDLHDVILRVNDIEQKLRIESRRTLAEVLREDLGLTGTHLGCEHGVCGACTVVVDGSPARSCLLLGVQVAGSAIETVESLGVDGEPGLVQRAMWNCHAFQCAFCAPGFLISVHCLLRMNPTPTVGQVCEELSGNLCRCTGYHSILEGVVEAIRILAEEGRTSGA
jgi:carbon-monoxide dehydrogenase small subunit